MRWGEPKTTYANSSTGAALDRDRLAGGPLALGFGGGASSSSPEPCLQQMSKKTQEKVENAYSGSSGATLDRDRLAGALALGFGFGDGLGARASSSSPGPCLRQVSNRKRNNKVEKTYSGSSTGAALDRDRLAGAFALGFGFDDGLGTRVPSSASSPEACLQEFNIEQQQKIGLNTYSGSSAGAAFDRDCLAGAFALGFGFGDGPGARASSSSSPEPCLSQNS